MLSRIWIGCLTSKYEAFFTSWYFFKMAANESRFDVLYFYTIAKINKWQLNVFWAAFILAVLSSIPTLQK